MNPAAKSFSYWRGLSPVKAVETAFERLASYNDPAMFITLGNPVDVLKEAATVMAAGAEGKPLFGLPFAVKDNIDVAGLPTTAACPDFSYMPKHTAFAVQRLQAAGAICIGKTNLDQFATGLVGVRSPYGVARNTLRADLVPGGSSSGSAVAVGMGGVAFSLGTDTAGSGRVPAALNGICGLKPSLGLLSATGVVPACRTLDTISIFAAQAGDAALVAAVAQGFDMSDFLSRALPQAGVAALAASFKVGVPRHDQLEFFGDRLAADAYHKDIAKLESLGGVITEIDFEPFFAVAKLLYEGPWVAERYHAVKALMEQKPEALHPVTCGIISRAAHFNAVDTFDALYKLAALKRKVEPTLASIDMIAVPSIPTVYTVADVEADPVRLNSNLGTYTNFVNLLDLAAFSVPVGLRGDGLPSSLTLIAKAGRDAFLAGAAQALQSGKRVAAKPAGEGEIALAVVGAHLTGMPLHHELTSRNARLLQATETSPDYKLFALANTKPAKPGLLRVAAGKGDAIAVEVWALSTEGFGSFVAAIPSPLGIGTLKLRDGTMVKGFIAESEALKDAQDISSFGGWRAFVASLKN
jgi:allophanate hydrolase